MTTSLFSIQALKNVRCLQLVIINTLLVLCVSNRLFSNPIVSGSNYDTRVDFHNAAIAYAYPVSDITIDGDSSDWPKNSIRYPIEKTPYTTVPKDKHDFQAYFQVGYNRTEQSLYIIVVVSDDHHVVDTSENADWNTQDTYNLYIDGEHALNGSGVTLYQFNEKFKDISNASISWDPTEKEMDWEAMEIMSKRRGTTTVYECRVSLGKHLYAGKSIGIDHVIIDKDPEDEMGASTFIAWGEGGGKSQAPGRLGDIILMENKQPNGTIRGQLHWKDPSIKGFPDKIRVTSVSHPTLWTQVSVDTTGNYSVMLPADTYTISPAQALYFNNDDIVRIDTAKDIQVVAQSGKNVKAPYFEIAHLPAPDLIPEEGILHKLTPEKLKALDHFISAYQAYYKIPGVSLALIKEGKVSYHKTYGVKNSFTQEAVDEETLFEAASITKPVFAFVVMRLAEQGVIDLDKPLYTYLPFEAIAHDDRYKLITARHVLSHKSGFPNWAWMNSDGKLDIKFTPGTRYGYSGEGFEYLKRVVSHITGKDISLLLKEEVIQPLELKNTYFKNNPYLAEVVAHGHYNNMPTRAELPNIPGMAWSMHTEAKAFSRFLLSLLNRKGLKAETYDEMFRIHTQIPKEDPKAMTGWNDYFGLGIHMQDTPYGATFGHGGNNGDFKCESRMYTDLKMGFVIFTNSNTGDLLNSALEAFLITGKTGGKK